MRKQGFLAPFFGGHRKRRSLLASPRNNLRAGRHLALEPLESRRLLTAALAVTPVENYYAPGPTTDGSLVTSIAGLSYISGANGNTVVSADVQLDANDGSGHDLSYVSAAVNLHGNDTVLNTVYYSGSGVDTSDSYRFSVPILGQDYSTGRYEFDMVVTEHFTGVDTTDVVTQQVYEDVVNWNSSAFGQEFSLQGLDQLYIDDSGVMYVRSDGTTAYFPGGDGSFTSPAGPFAFTSLTQSGGGDSNYVLTDPATGITEDFSSAGLLQTVSDSSGNTSTYNWSGR